MKLKSQEDIWKDRLERDYNKITDYNSIESFNENDREDIFCSILDHENIIDHWNWLQSKIIYTYFTERFPQLHGIVESVMEEIKNNWQEESNINQERYLGPTTVDGIRLFFIKMYLNL